MKKLFTLILIITLSFSTVTEAYEQKTYPYNNQEKVTKISKINAKEWRIPYIILGAGSGTRYSIESMEFFMGEPIPYLRYHNERYYGIYKTGSKKEGYHYLILTFIGESLSDSWYVSMIPDKEKFLKKVKEGTKLKTVKEIDPDTYNVLEQMPNDTMSYYMSCHRFEDGTIAYVYYQRNIKKEWIVKEIRYQQDELKVVQNLLEQDLLMIKNNKVIASNKRKPASVKIKSAKRSGKKSIIVKFKKAKNAKKYEIQYATNKKFKKAKIKTTKKCSYTIKKLSKKKTYYIRVRGINKTVKGKWSKIRRIKGKK